MKPGLYVTATPIGNLGDMTARAIETLKQVDLIAAEDTRVTGNLLRHFGINTPLTAYHDHNADRERPKILEKIAGGKAVALVSDAGTPLISDPGCKLVAEAAAQGLFVTAMPGPSAAIMALSVAGLPTDRFLFAGFLSAKAGARAREIADLAATRATLVFYEAPHRVPESVAALAEGLGARDAAVCRELTKMFEEIRRGPLDQLAAHYAEAGAPKGEVVIIVAPPAEKAATGDEDLLAVLKPLLEVLSVNDAAKAAAALTGRAKRDAYDHALKLKG